MKRNGSTRFRLSISSKMILIIVICVFALTISFAVITAIFMGNILSKNAASHMTLFCDDRGMELDNELIRVEDAVGYLSGWATSRMTSVDKISNDDDFRMSLLSDTEGLMHFASDDNDFIQSVYIHYTLDITGPVDTDEGIYLSRDDSGELAEIPFTQSEIAEDPGSEYWYYAPISSGAAMWTDPYYDESIDDYLISYVSPVFIGDTPVAVIGIDVSFSRVIEYVNDVKYHDTGYMYLKAGDGSVHYHPAYLRGEDIHGDEQDNVVDDGELGSSYSDGDIIQYEFRGGNRVMVFMTLRNGMKLVLCDSFDEIFYDRTLALRIMAITSVALAIIFVIIIYLLTSSVIIKPIRMLTAATNSIGEGNYNINLPKASNDEIGDLTRDFNLAISNIRQRSEDMMSHVEKQEEQIKKDEESLRRRDKDLREMKNIAYSDALTGVKNKTAYDDTRIFIDRQIEKGTASFAVVMCDLNYLKLINDERGHQAGDDILKRTAKLLCSVFPLSTVFRIGGDEFVVLPYGMEYEKLDSMLDILAIEIRNERSMHNKLTERISLAVGSAVYDPEMDQSFKEVFERADMAMYEDKRIIHETDGIAMR